MYESILSGVLANLAFLIILIAFAWIIFISTKRRTLYGFFNIKSSQRLVLYLSNLRIIKGGTIGIDNKTRNYEGTAVTFYEYLVSDTFRRIFYYPIQPLIEQPGILKRILFSDVNVQILKSPLEKSEIDNNASIISIGSPGYNAVSKYIEEDLNSNCRFDKDYVHISIKGIPSISDPTQAFIERIIDSNNNRSVFYVAGISEAGTTGAMHILTMEWNRLRKKYGNDKPFVIVVKVYPPYMPTEKLKWTIVFEREN